MAQTLRENAAFVTLKRVRAYATLIALSLWTIWAIDFAAPGSIDRLGKVKGTDFLQFYAAGSLVRDGRLDQLYDLGALSERARAVAPQSRDTLYVPIQSPQTALAFAPLSRLSYPPAALLWIAAIVLLYAAACRITWSHCARLHGHRYEVIACSAASPALYSAVLHGQTSVVALVAIALALVALRRHARFAAGAALGLLVFKPHWALAAAAIFAAALEWRVVAGLVASAAAQLAATAAIVGARVMIAYGSMLQSVQRIGDLLEPYPGDSLRSFFKVFVPWPPVAAACYGLGALLVLLVAARIWRSGAAFEVRASAMLLSLVLVSPHAFAYDLVMLTPVFFLLANWMDQEAGNPSVRPVAWLLCALFAAPLLSAIPAAIRLQFSVTAMGALLFHLRAVSQAASDRRSARRSPTPDARSAGSADSGVGSGQAEIGHATARPAAASVAAR